MSHAKTVLIVEDEDTLGSNLREYLARRGWQAQLARNGSGAVAITIQFVPGVVLLDYQLPDMDGFQALGAIRTRHPACGCVLMTAHPLDRVAERSREHRIAHILSKPFALAEMECRLLAEMAGSGCPGAA